MLIVSAIKPSDVKNPPVDEVLLEDTVLSQPWIRAPQTSPILDKFFEKVALKLALPDTSLAVLEAFSSLDQKAERVADAMRRNPYYEYQFLKVIESLGKREDKPSVEAAIVLLGMQNSRDLLFSMQMLRNIKGTHPEWDPNGKLTYQPAQAVKYAKKAEEFLAAKKDEYASMAYAGGLMFDFVAALAQELLPDPKAVHAYLDVIFNHGFKAARFGREFVSTQKDFTHKKFIFATCLVHDIGKGFMATLDPDYLVFNEECIKAEVPRHVRTHAEEKRYGCSHPMIGAIACSYFNVFKKVAPAVFFHHAPYMLKKGQKGLYDLTCMVSFCSNLSGQFKNPANAQDPLFEQWKGDELKGYPLDNNKLFPIIQKISREGM